MTIITLLGLVALDLKFRLLLKEIKRSLNHFLFRLRRGFPEGFPIYCYKNVYGKQQFVLLLFFDTQVIVIGQVRDKWWWSICNFSKCNISECVYFIQILLFRRSL